MLTAAFQKKQQYYIDDADVFIFIFVQMNKKVREELAKTLIDLGKYIFAGVVLGATLQFEKFDKLNLILLGIGSTILFIILGLMLLAKNK